MGFNFGEVSYIEHHQSRESGIFGAMSQEPTCPCCGEKMRIRRSDSREQDYVFECRDCSLSYVTSEPLWTIDPQHVAR